MKKNVFIPVLGFLFLFVSACSLSNSKNVKYRGNNMIHLTEPKAPKKLHITKKFGVTLKDYFYWMRNRKSPDVLKYIKAENEYTKKYMKHTEKLQRKLYDEMRKRLPENDISAPYRKGSYFYYSKDIKGAEYPCFYRKKMDGTGNEELILDENALAKGHGFYSIGFMHVSPDENLLAYSFDTNGSELYRLKIKNLKTGKYLGDTIYPIDDLVWLKDGKSFLYTKLDDTKRPYAVYKHTLGNDKDKLLYKEKDPKFWVGINKTLNDQYVFIVTSSKDTSEILYIKNDGKDEKFKLFSKRERGIEYYPETDGKRFFILTNRDTKFREYKIMVTSLDKTDVKNWKDYIIPKEDEVIADMTIFKKYMVLSVRRDGIKEIKIIPFNSPKDFYYINFSDKNHNVSLSKNYIFDTDLLRVVYSSFLTPYTIYEYNMKNKTKKILKKYEVKGYEPSKYVSEYKKVFVKDNTGKPVLVPVSIMYKKGIKMDGSAPCYLTGYGAYGDTNDPYFSSSRLSLLDRGFVYAVAHIRGGGELGKKWYEDGKMLTKRHTFLDFINVAKYLIKEKYTSSKKLVISGGSAGGLLIGAVINMNPSLFRVAILDVPFVDMMNTMLDPTIPLTVAEYEEWGNPNKEIYFKYMLSYSPYDNIKRQNYPALLITGGWNDPRVQYWEPLKFTAKLRMMKTDKNPLLLKMNMGFGHMGASGRYAYLKDIAFEYAFIFDILKVGE